MADKNLESMALESEQNFEKDGERTTIYEKLNLFFSRVAYNPYVVRFASMLGFY